MRGIQGSTGKWVSTITFSLVKPPPAASSEIAFRMLGWSLPGGQDHYLYEVTVGDETAKAGPGSIVFIPRNVVHRFKNVGGITRGPR